MKKRIKQVGPAFLIMIVAFACYEPYQSPAIDGDTSYLVVDAFMNSTDNSISVTLSRTLPLNAADTLHAVNDAVVKLEDDSGITSAVNFMDEGVYSATGLTLRPDRKYKIVIAAGEKVYQSALVTVQQTPPIDTVSWSIDRDNLDINVSTHDPQGASQFYRWKFDETWQYMAPFPTTYIVKDDSVVVRTKDEDISTCWQSVKNSRIVLYSTAELNSDAVSNYTIQTIPSNSIKLSNKYSIRVQQQTLSKDAYTYWLNIKKTTESLGSIFDPLPAAVSGNITCVTNPGERVIGFFSAGSVSEKRIYIKSADLLSFTDYKHQICTLDTIICDTFHLAKGWYDPSKPRIHFQNPDEVIGVLARRNDGSYIIGYAITSTLCTDCRQLGGHTSKPAFWKD